MEALESVRLRVLEWRTGGDAKDWRAVGESCGETWKAIAESGKCVNGENESCALDMTYPLFAVTKHTPTFPDTFA